MEVWHEIVCGDEYYCWASKKLEEKKQKIGDGWLKMDWDESSQAVETLKILWWTHGLTWTYVHVHTTSRIGLLAQDSSQR